MNLRVFQNEWSKFFCTEQACPDPFPLGLMCFCSVFDYILQLNLSKSLKKPRGYVRPTSPSAAFFSASSLLKVDELSLPPLDPSDTRSTTSICANVLILVTEVSEQVHSNQSKWDYIGKDSDL